MRVAIIKKISMGAKNMRSSKKSKKSVEKESKSNKKDVQLSEKELNDVAGGIDIKRKLFEWRREANKNFPEK
jgi:hypothetical protein